MLTLLTLSSLGGAAPAHATSGSAAQVPPKAAPGEFGSETWHDPADDLLPDPGPFLRDVSKLVADRYAGGWVERPTDPAQRDAVAWLRVAIVKASDADRAAVARLAQGNQYITVVPANYSLSQLRDWKEVFIGYFITTKPGQFLVDDNETANKVKVSVETTPPGLAAYATMRGVPDDAWTLDNDIRPMRAEHTSRSSGLPYEGGLQGDMYDGYSYSYCTTWFTTRTSTGSYKAATAGHCENNSSVWMWIGPDALGDGAMNSYLGQTRTSSDAVRYTVNTGQQTNRLMLAAGVHASVSNRYYISNGGEPVAGMPVCLLGAFSGGGTCGTINSADVTRTDEHGVIHDHFWQATYASMGGDSGGAVYRTNPDGTKKAAGIHHGSDGVFTYFHHVSLVLSDLDVNLYYG